MSYNIIGDIAGRYDELIQLVDKMPEGEVIAVGDLVDRGDQSRQVIEYFMEPGRRAILGNHEHLMLDHLLKGGFYQPGIWFWNGGGATLESYPDREVPQEHIDWLLNLPKYIEVDGCLISHAFLRPSAIDDQVVLEENCEFGAHINRKGESTIIWNRGRPVRRESWRLQICGHNSQMGLKEFRDDEGLFAICLDDSRNEKLTGLHLPTLEVFQVDYLDKEPEEEGEAEPLWK